MGRRALIPIGANKNLCGNKLREMTAYEFHCMQGHMGYFKGCIICELVPRSLRRVKVDTVLHGDHPPIYNIWETVQKDFFTIDYEGVMN